MNKIGLKIVSIALVLCLFIGCDQPKSVKYDEMPEIERAGDYLLIGPDLLKVDSIIMVAMVEKDGIYRTVIDIGDEELIQYRGHRSTCAALRALIIHLLVTGE